MFSTIRCPSRSRRPHEANERPSGPELEAPIPWLFSIPRRIVAAMSDAKRPILRGFYEDFRDLAKAPRGLWIVYAAKFTESIAYFALVNVLILYLHEDLGFSDEWAGGIYGVWAMGISLLVFVAGFLADAMGKRKALLVAALTLIASRAMLGLSEVTFVPLLGLALGTWGVASMKPVMVAVVKKYAPGKIRAFAYSIFYVVMNFGAFAAGGVVSWLRIGLLGRSIRPSELFEDVPVAPEAARLDLVRELVPSFPAPEGATEADAVFRSFARGATARDVDFWTAGDIEAIRHAAELHLAGQPIPDAPIGLSGYEMIFLLTAVISVLTFLILRLLPAEAESTSVARQDDASALEVLRRAVRIAVELSKEKSFWGFVVFVGTLALVKAVFVHAHTTWPTYMLREFGRETPQATIWAFNPLLIMILTPFIGSATSRFSAWWVIIVGAFITASSLLFMVSPEPTEAIARSLFEPYFGSEVHFEYAGAYCFVFVLSVGEALWSPRLYEYVAMMAPKGREASYMGLSELPYFAAKIPVGLMSGFLIAGYCAENTECQSEPIWLIVFSAVLVGPLLALLFSGFIRAAERARLAEESGEPREF